LGELQEERDDYHHLYVKILGNLHSATGDQFSAYFLKDNQVLPKTNGKLRDLVHHNAFPKSFF
jgi:hypothetical protein